MKMTRVPLSCGHRGDAPASLVLRAAYPTAFCDRCQDVKPIRQRKPSARRIGGGVR